MKRLHYYAAATFLLLVAISSCKKVDLNKITYGEWHPDLALPLAYSTFDVYDIFARTNSSDLVIVDTLTGALSLVYESDITVFEGGDLTTIDNFSESQNVTLSDFGGLPSPGFSSTLTYSGQNTTDFNFTGGAEIKEIQFDEGLLNLDITSRFKHPFSITISIPSMKKNGVGFSTIINVNAATSSPATSQITENLKDYIADLTLNNTTNNKLKIEYVITLNGNGNPLLPTDDLDIDFGFSSLKMNYVKGYLGVRNFNLPEDTVLLKVFQFSENGHFELINPKVRLSLINSFGVPSQLDLNQIRTVNTNTGQVSDLLGYTQHHPLLSPSVMWDSATTTILLDKTNTNNIENIVEPTPKLLTVNANVIMNPNGNTGVDNFVTKDSKLRLNSEVELPLHGLAHSFTVRDTSNFNSPGEAKNLKNVMFRLIVNNGFPVSVFAKIRFLDSEYQEVFEFSQNQIMLVESAPVDAAGKVTSILKKITDIKLNEAQIKLLDEVKYIEILGEANTKDFAFGKNVKIYDTYKMDLKLSGKFEFKF